MIRVYASLEPAEIDFMAAAAALSLMPGRIAVEMHPVQDSYLGIELTDKRKEKVRTMVGTVLAVGPSLSMRNPLTVGPGDVVICHPLDGKRIRGFRAGAYRANGEVRMFGIVAKHLGKPVLVPWHESVMGVLMKDELYATGKNVLLRLQAKSQVSDGGIVLVDNMQDRPDVAEVVSIGPACQDLGRLVKVGDMVMYERRALKQLTVNGDDSLAFIEEDGIHGKVAA